MSDFETHPIGTATEIRCSRELARAIQEWVGIEGNDVLPVNVLQAYNKLCGQYIRQIQMESL